MDGRYVDTATTVSVEPVSGYTAENAYLYDENETVLSGMKFTFDSDYVSM